MVWFDGWQALLPELILLLFALLVPISGLWDPDRRGLVQSTLVGLAGALGLTILQLTRTSFDLFGVAVTFDHMGTTFQGVYSVDFASQTFKALFLGCALLAVLGTRRALKGRAEADWGEFYSLLLFATLGMMVVASSRELVTLFLGIETASMSSYLLAGFRRDRIGAEASLKYFVIGAIASGTFLFGISLVYGLAGTTTLEGLREHFASGADTSMAVVAVVMMLAGLGFKVSAVPFHAWAPDVYSGAPPPVVGLLASASKAMGFAAIFQVFLIGLWGFQADWELAIGAVAVVSMLVGNLVALQQTNLRRMLAYSSIAQAGYLLIAVAVGTQYAVTGGILHLWVNAAMKLGAFLVVGSLLYAGLPDHVDSWRGLNRRAPLLAFAMALFLLSMAGLPPLGGFTSKFVLFSGAVRTGLTGPSWLIWLALAAVVNSAISLYYYLRVIRAMYVEAGDAPAGRISVGPGATVAVVVCAALVVLVGVWPAWFYDLSERAAATLLAST